MSNVRDDGASVVNQKLARALLNERAVLVAAAEQAEEIAAAWKAASAEWEERAYERQERAEQAERER